MYSAGDIAELEKKYSIYKTKKIIKIFIFFVAFVAILSLLFYFFWYKKDHSISIKTQKQSISQPVKTVIMPTINKEINNTNSSKFTATTLKPKMSEKNGSRTLGLSIAIKPVVKSAEPNTAATSLILKLPTVQIDQEKNVEPVLKTKNTPKVKKEVKKEPIIKNTSKEQETSDSNHSAGIKIVMKNIDAITYLKDKFNEKHSIVFALMLCKEYYQKKDFTNSLKWSIIANDIDSTNERSWIWFAKSKYRLNKKQDAIKALKAYLKTNSSDSVKSLLHDIINGELYE